MLYIGAVAPSSHLISVLVGPMLTASTPPLRSAIRYMFRHCPGCSVVSAWVTWLLGAPCRSSALVSLVTRFVTVKKYPWIQEYRFLAGFFYSSCCSSKPERQNGTKLVTHRSCPVADASVPRWKHMLPPTHVLTPLCKCREIRNERKPFQQGCAHCRQGRQARAPTSSRVLPDQRFLGR